MRYASNTGLMGSKWQKTMQFVVSNEHKPREILKALSIHPVLSNYQLSNPVSFKPADSDSSFSRIERSYRVNAYKFGVLYCREGQDDENDMFSNTEVSEDYLAFLAFLGEEITLEGWTRFRGGLDVQSESISGGLSTSLILPSRKQYRPPLYLYDLQGL